MVDRDKLADDFLMKMQELVYDVEKWHEKQGQYSVDFETIVDGYVVRVQVLPEQWLKESEVDIIKMTTKKTNPCYTLCKYWLDTYLRMLGHPYAKSLSVKERAMLKNILNEYDLEYAEAMIRYFLKHYNSLPKYHGAPTVPGFVGYRKTIALMMEEKKNGKLKNHGGSML